MRSGYKVIWSQESVKNLDNIVNYLKENWTEREIRNFFLKLQKIIELISTRPELFNTTSKRKGIRRCVLSRQTCIYYKVDKRKIYIVSIFDNRQDPSKQNL